MARRPRNVKPKPGSEASKVSAVRVGNKALKDKTQKDIINALMAMIGPSVCVHRDKVNLFRSTLLGLAAVTNNKGHDKQRQMAYAKGESNVVPHVRFPKTLGHVNDLAVNILQILFPARTMYGSVEIDPNKQKEAAALVHVMNLHAKQFKHYTNFHRAVLDALIYNLGIAEAEWADISSVFGDAGLDRNNLTQSTRRKSVKTGERIRHLDVFNTILDAAADFDNYAVEAEFYAKVERFSAFQLQRMARAGDIGLTDHARKALRAVRVGQDGQIDNKADGKDMYSAHGHLFSNNVKMLWEDRPILTENVKLYDAGVEGSRDCDGTSPFNVSDYMGDNRMGANSKSTAPNEMLTITAHVVPKDMGFGTSTDLEVWQFKVLNGQHLVSIKPGGAAHGMLPIGVTVPRTEMGQHESQSTAQLLLPFQEASSSLLNIFLRQARKETNNGVTYHYDDIDMNSMADPSSGSVSIPRVSERNGQTVPIRNLVHNQQGQQTSTAALTADQHVNTRMQDIVPTNAISQLASLNRPVSHQSRQLTQMLNLQIFVTARVIHDQMVEPLSYMHTRDIIENQESITLFDAQGQAQEIDATVFKSADIDISVSDGLRGIDTIAVADRMQTLLQYAFQSGKIQQEYDVVKMTGYLLQLEGANINMDSFKYETQFDALPAEQKQMAFELFQQAVAAQQQAAEGEGEQPQQ